VYRQNKGIITWWMINGLSKEFSAKTKAEEKGLCGSSAFIVNTDFTNARVNGKNVQVAICATPVIRRKHKGHKGIAGTPVEDYMVYWCTTTISHFTVMATIIRMSGSRTSLSELAKEPCESCCRKSTTEKVFSDPAKVKEFENSYIEILELAKVCTSQGNYYRDGYNLYKRLDKYRNSHLLFLHDERVPTNNNLCERKGRIFKRKQKQVMAFRSFDSLSYLCDSMSIN
jgi:hypothetical protein